MDIRKSYGFISFCIQMIVQLIFIQTIHVHAYVSRVQRKLTIQFSCNDDNSQWRKYILYLSRFVVFFKYKNFVGTQVLGDMGPPPEAHCWDAQSIDSHATAESKGTIESRRSQVRCQLTQIQMLPCLCMLKFCFLSYMSKVCSQN